MAEAGLPRGAAVTREPADPMASEVAVLSGSKHRWSVRSYAYAVICDLKGVRTYVRVRTSGPYAYASRYVRTTSGHD